MIYVYTCIRMRARTIKNIFILLSATVSVLVRACVSGERRIFEEVPGAKTPSRACDDDSGVAFAFGRGDRGERRGEGQVRGCAVARLVDQ